MKRIEMDWTAGSHYSVFTKAVTLAKEHNCKDVVFEFNGGFFSVNPTSVWSEEVSKDLMQFPRKHYEMKL